MKKLSYIILLFFLGFNLMSQNPAAREKIETARIAMINNRLDLAPDQAEKFWPIYNEYSKKRSGFRKEYMESRQQLSNEGMTEEESEKLLEIGLRMKENQVALEREYSEKLSKVITNKQLLALRKAEEDFRQMLIERLKERRGKHQERGQSKRLKSDY